jgi:hypothetical protein
MKQRHAGLAFQARDGRRHSRLGAMKRLGRASDVFALGHRHEQAQLL